MSETTASFSDVLRRLRSQASLSQRELAARAGLSRRGIGDLERGVHHAPYLATVRMLADALNLDENDRATLLAAARPGLVATPSGPIRLPSIDLLPLPPTRLIGREAEVAAIAHL